jgi:hypothetical protein
LFDFFGDKLVQLYADHQGYVHLYLKHHYNVMPVDRFNGVNNLFIKECGIEPDKDGVEFAECRMHKTYRIISCSGD